MSRKVCLVRKKYDTTERARGQGRKTREEIGKGESNDSPGISDKGVSGGGGG